MWGGDRFLGCGGAISFWGVEGAIALRGVGERSEAHRRYRFLGMWEGDRFDNEGFGGAIAWWECGGAIAFWDMGGR